MLAEHREQLDALARATLENVTLDEPDAYAAADVPRATHAGPARRPVGADARRGR
jgi:hypothetical protein